MVGGQDELVFDGHSLVFDPDGELIARGPSFEEELVVADLDIGDVFHRRLHDPARRKESGRACTARTGRRRRPVLPDFGQTVGDR